MPSCCVPGCQSGYQNEDLQTITFHRFPLSDKQRIDLWLSKIHRDNYTPNASSRVCSLHFNSSDYKQERTDGNLQRRKRKNPLSRKILRDDAYPSVFPRIPSYLTESPINRRDAPTSTKRLNLENDRQSELILKGRS